MTHAKIAKHGPMPLSSDWVDSLAWENLKELVRSETVSDNPNDKQKKALEDLPVRLCELFNLTSPSLIKIIDIKDHNSLVYGKWKAIRENAPTVLLYAHYDVVRADGTWDEPEKSEADPFEPYDWCDEKSKLHRLYGRGAADDKSGIIMHLSTLRNFQARLPVNVILVIEGEEEIGTGSLDDYIKSHPDMFQADVIVIADTGNVAEAKPTLTTSLRGLVSADVTVKTLDHSVHSGMFGGPAPDAFMALVRIINDLVNAKGDAAVDGLMLYTDPNWPPSSLEEEELFRNQAGVLPGVELIGTGSITQRVAGSPAIIVTGLNGIPEIEHSVNQLHPSAKARISVRIAPNQDPDEAYNALRNYLMKDPPFGAKLTVEKGPAGEGFYIKDGRGRGQFFDIACKAVKDAYGGKEKCVSTGLGGTIPMIGVIADVQDKDATIVMWGCEEPLCNIHGTLESVSREELIRLTQAEINLLNYVAKEWEEIGECEHVRESETA